MQLLNGDGTVIAGGVEESGDIKLLKTVNGLF